MKDQASELTELRWQVEMYSHCFKRQEQQIQTLSDQCAIQDKLTQVLREENLWLWNQVHRQQNQIWKYLRVIKQLKALICSSN